MEVNEQVFRQQMRELKSRIHDDPAVRAQYDTDGDGEVSGEEWERAVAMLRQELSERPEAAACATFDALRSRTYGGQPSLTACREIIIKQEVEVHEVVIGWETANRYQFLDAATNREVGGAEETGTGIGNHLVRQFLGPGRPLTLSIAAPGEGIWIEGKRAWAILGALSPPPMTVSNAEGTLGTVRRVWPILLWRRYQVVPVNSFEPPMMIEGVLWHPWTFPVVRGGQRVACIRKKWSGLGKEMFTDADNFRVTFEDPGLSAQHRLLLLAAALAIDYDFFEKSPRD